MNFGAATFCVHYCRLYTSIAIRIAPLTKIIKKSCMHFNDYLTLHIEITSLYDYDFGLIYTYTSVINIFSIDECISNLAFIIM